MENSDLVKIYPEIGDKYEDLLVIPDANILLFLYKCSSNASQKLIEILEAVKDKTIIPNQAYLEYLEHKDAEKGIIEKKYENYGKDLVQIIDRIEIGLNKRIAEAKKHSYPQSTEFANSINSNLELMRTEIKNHCKAISTEKDNINDQISKIEDLMNYYENNQRICKEISMDLKLKYISEGELRYKYKMPPGYEDEDKDKEKKDPPKDPKKDNFQFRIKKFGDLFIWKEIIDIGNKNKDKCILFLTNDVKEDWWEVKGKNKEPVVMRKELSKEFCDATGNNSILFMELWSFYGSLSRHFKIQDKKTEIELNIKRYVEDNISRKYEKDTYDHIQSFAYDIDYSNIDDGFAASETPDCLIDDVRITDYMVYFDGDDAIYRIEYEADVSLEFGTTDNDGDYFQLGNAYITIVFELVFDREINEEEINSIDFNFIDYTINSTITPYDLYDDQNDDKFEKYNEENYLQTYSGR